MKPSKNEIIRDLIEFFLEDLSNDAVDVGDWLAQGHWDADQFIGAVYKLKSELKLRD